MYRILDILKEEKGYLSGEAIGKRLEISRAAVWKGIQRLRKEGYEIEAVTNKGYRLTAYDTMYNQRELETGLRTQKMGRPLYFYPETDTTNHRIRELALEGAPEGTLAVAEKQTAGRGRLGRHWEAPAGTGIWMSLLLRPNIVPAEASVLTLLAGIALTEAVQDVTGLSPAIKWPNDILLNGKKLAGILTEMDCEMSQVHFIVSGMGINVNTAEFPEELRDIATSLYLESGRTFSRRQLLQRVLECFEGLYHEFLQAGSFSPFLERYRAKCLNLGKEVRVIGRETFLATALDITPSGELVVKRQDTGKEEIIFSGEVSIRGEEQRI
ncbi:MAG: biotin--[Anaerotignum sp.]|nr:biotin--[acetyl-CoA-carboxylase] ligase [Anaerotignum sp.]